MKSVIKDKSGQFYLLAAVIIIAVIIGFFSITNYSKKDNKTIVNDLGKELGIEGGKVLDYGVVQNKDLVIDDFVSKYSSYSDNEQREIIFIYGDKDQLYMVSSDETSLGKISQSGTSLSVNYNLINKKELEVNSNGEVVVILNEKEYLFKINEGQNFYFIISEEQGDNQYVIQG